MVPRFDKYLLGYFGLFPSHNLVVADSASSAAPVTIAAAALAAAAAAAAAAVNPRVMGYLGLQGWLLLER